MLKQNAKLALKGHWGKAIVVLLVFLALIAVLMGVQQYAISLFIGIPAASNPTMQEAPYYASEAEIVILSIFSLLTILLVIPLEMGVLRWFYGIVHGKDMSIADAFTFFESIKRYVKGIGLYLNILARCLLWAIPFFCLPSALMGVSLYLVNGNIRLFGDSARLNATLGTMGTVLSFALFILAVILYIICTNRYALALYLFYDDMDMGMRKAIKTSVQYSKGCRSSLFIFQLSFIGWMLLCHFVIPAFFVIPYYYTAYAMYARYIIEKNTIKPAEPTREFAVQQSPDPATDLHVDEVAPVEEIRGVEPDIAEPSLEWDTQQDTDDGPEA
jgi:uncharacterized membrane protein